LIVREAAEFTRVPVPSETPPAENTILPVAAGFTVAVTTTAPLWAMVAAAAVRKVVVAAGGGAMVTVTGADADAKKAELPP
jgi:hypothetical protein